MADIKLTFTADKIARAITAFSAIYGWTSATGLTQAQFAKAQVIKFVNEVIKAHEVKELTEAARLAAIAAAEQDEVNDPIV